MQDEVLNFIHRRFPSDDNWLSGNCYYFTIILKSRFPYGEIWYDLVEGHFLYEYRGKFYDWSGVVKPNKNHLVNWFTYALDDPLHYERIVKDVIQ